MLFTLLLSAQALIGLSIAGALHAHAERFVAARWRHPLLEHRMNTSSAILVEVLQGVASVLRGNQLDALSPCQRREEGEIVGYLVLDDEGDHACANGR